MIKIYILSINESNNNTSQGMKLRKSYHITNKYYKQISIADSNEIVIKTF